MKFSGSEVGKCHLCGRLVVGWLVSCGHGWRSHPSPQRMYGAAQGSDTPTSASSALDLTSDLLSLETFLGSLFGGSCNKDYIVCGDIGRPRF